MVGQVKTQLYDVRFSPPFQESFRIGELPQMLVAAHIEAAACERGRALDRFP